MTRDLERYATMNPSEIKIIEALKSFTGSLEVKKCLFCRGWGHYAKQCSTKNTIDSACKYNPEWKVVWGSFKSKKKYEGGKKRAKETFKTLQTLAQAADLGGDYEPGEEEEQEESAFSSQMK